MKYSFLKQAIPLLISISIVPCLKAQSIEKIMMQPMHIIYVTDTAQTTDSFSLKMGKGYAKLFTQVGQQQQRFGKILTVYQTTAAPWIFDIALEVYETPKKLTGGVQFKTLEGGEAIVMHFKGPYEDLHNAYAEIEDWLQKNNYKKRGAPIEVYLNSPQTEKDKNKLQTEVYQRIQK